MVLPVAIAAVVSVQAPTTNASCLGAPFRLKTDNVPVSNDTATSVINIWAFVDRTNRAPAAWLYKNLRGDYYAQFNYRIPTSQFQGVPLADKFFAKPRLGTYLNLVNLTPEQVVSLENALIAKGFSRAGCFSKDAKM